MAKYQITLVFSSKVTEVQKTRSSNKLGMQLRTGKWSKYPVTVKGNTVIAKMPKQAFKHKDIVQANVEKSMASVDGYLVSVVA